MVLPQTETIPISTMQSLKSYNIWTTLNKIINAPCGTLKLLLALGFAKYIKSYKIHFVVQYATDYCPLEHDNYKTISAHLGSPISCYINNLHAAFIFLARYIYSLTPSLRRQCIHAIFLSDTHSVFWELGRKPCQHATRGCDKRWMTCIHAGVSRSPREHASVPPDKRHCRQGMSEWNGMSEWIFA